MAKMTLQELKKLREDKKKELNRRDITGNQVVVTVGMGTCGIAAGAKEALNAFLDELEQQDIQNVTLRQTGCMGLCYVEPTVEVKVPEMPSTIYGNVDASVAREIVVKHIKGKELLNNHIFDKPAPDIVND